MAKTLFIVESPNKCPKIRSILGNDYIVQASVGHIREIPKKGLNIDVSNDFAPKFVISASKKDVVQTLKKLSDQADEILLATDADREGESIAWHIYELLSKSNQKKCSRVTFGEITKQAVLNSLKNKRAIDMNLVFAQQARQILDRLVGYKISPVLWFTVGSGTSAGRVQSIALKIVSEREIEINDFKPSDFWYIDANLKAKQGEFIARVVTKDKDNRYEDEKISIKDYDALKQSSYSVGDVEKKEKKTQAYPPFDTPSMLQASTAVLKWPVKKTTAVAQQLYSTGMVTYIRTDSFSVSQEALKSVRDLIGEKIGDKYLPKKPNVYTKKSKVAAQEAHECIRPTHSEDKGDSISNADEKSLYDLIRKRFIASQMSPLVCDTVSYVIKASCGKKLIAKGQAVKFDGWTKVYNYNVTKESHLPVVDSNEDLKLLDLDRSKHTTQPPPRYNEASLVKKMESEGVGRPSTYSHIMESIKKRGYIEFLKGKNNPIQVTEIGLKVFNYLQANFGDFFMDIGFTSNMEDDLVKIADGDKNYIALLQETYDLLQSEINKARKDNKGIPDPSTSNNQPTGVMCLVCKSNEIVSKVGKYGEFFSCSGYPKCKTVYRQDGDKFVIYDKSKPSSPPKDAEPCPECKKKGLKGVLLERKNKSNGNMFKGCNQYPKCKYTESVFSENNAKKGSNQDDIFAE